MKLAKFLSVAVALAVGASSANAALSINSVAFTYNQNFDLLSTTGSANAWANDSTIAGWSLFNSTGAAITAYSANDGSSNTGSFYSYGTTASSDRALGGLASGGTYFGSPASGAVAGWTTIALQNNSGATLSSFTLGFDGEQWRNGGNTSAQSMVLQYGFGSTFATVATWNTPGGSFNWSSPIATATAAAVDGNAAGKVTGLGGTVNTTWGNGQTLWVRWIENNDVGNDHGLAIDNFSLSVAAVPEPETYALMLGGLGLLGFSARRRSNKK